MDSIFLQTFKDSKNINLIFASLKKLEKHAFDFLQACKVSKNVHLNFCKLKQTQKNMHLIFFATLKKLQSYGDIFCNLKKRKNYENNFCKLKNLKKHEFVFTGKLKG